MAKILSDLALVPMRGPSTLSDVSTYTETALNYVLWLQSPLQAFAFSMELLELMNPACTSHYLWEDKDALLVDGACLCPLILEFFLVDF